MNTIVTNQPYGNNYAQANSPLLPAPSNGLTLNGDNKHAAFPALPYPISHTVMPSAPGAPAAGVSVATAPTFGGIDPPTYEQATRPSVNTDGNVFMPKYPMFKRATSYSFDVGN